MANIVGLLAARAAMAGRDVRAGRGVGGDARRLRVYASTETHTWLQKAADMAGLGTDAIRWIATDDALRMDSAASCGRLSTPIDAAGDAAAPRRRRPPAPSAPEPSIRWPTIAAICRDARLWLHVDGAYGGCAAAVPERAGGPPGARARATRVALDPHKWLYAPLEAGCALVRDAERLRDAFSYHPPYYHFDEAATNYFDFGPQNSRGFRALKVWLALRQAGRAGYVRMIGDDIRLADRLHGRVAAHPRPGGGHAVAEHHHVPLRAGGPAAAGRRGPGRARLPRYLESRAARRSPAVRPGLRLERDRRAAPTCSAAASSTSTRRRPTSTRFPTSSPASAGRPTIA